LSLCNVDAPNQHCSVSWRQTIDELLRTEMLSTLLQPMISYLNVRFQIRDLKAQERTTAVAAQILRQSLLIVLNSCLALDSDGPQRTTTVNLGPVQQKWQRCRCRNKFRSL